VDSPEKLDQRTLDPGVDEQTCQVGGEHAGGEDEKSG
jgi:hypothetical protein